MNVKCFDNGVFGSNAYLIWANDQTEAILIDTGVKPDGIIKFLNQQGLIIKKIILTHYHFDHIVFLNELQNLTKAEVYIHKDDASGLLDPDVNGSFYYSGAITYDGPKKILKDQDIVICEGLSFKVIHTPGHTPGGICLHGHNVLFSGDTLFRGSVGRTDLPGAKPNHIIPSIKQKLFTLPPQTIVYPGHGASTTIEFEMAHNHVIKSLDKN